MKIYFHAPEYIHHSKHGTKCEQVIYHAFGANVLNRFEFEGTPKTGHYNAFLFDQLYECDVIVVYPFEDGNIDEQMEWEIKMFMSLHRRTYFMFSDYRIVRYEEVIE